MPVVTGPGTARCFSKLDRPEAKGRRGTCSPRCQPAVSCLRPVRAPARRLAVPRWTERRCLSRRSCMSSFHESWLLAGHAHLRAVDLHSSRRSLNMTLSILNEWRQRRRVWPDPPDDEWPFVSVALAAYNEEKVIARTVGALRDSELPYSRQVRGSRGQPRRLDGPHAGDPAGRLRGWDRLQGDGPARIAASPRRINNAVRHADPRATVIVTMDADTLFRTID